MFTLCLADVSTTRTYSSAALKFSRRRLLLLLLPSIEDRRRHCPSPPPIPGLCSRPPPPPPPPPPPLQLRAPAAPTPRPPVSARASMDSFFIDALVRASLCKHHSSTGVPARPRPLSTLRRTYSTHALPPPTTTALVPQPQYSAAVKSELKSFSDPYHEHDAAGPAAAADAAAADDDDDPPPAPHPNDRKASVHPPLPWHTPRTPEAHAALRRFLRQLPDPAVPLDTLHRSYRALPAPPIAHLHLHHINAFLARLMTVPQRTEAATLRYLGVLDDLRASGLPISRPEYNAGIAFVARCFRAVTVREARAAIRLWQRSEAEAAAVPSDITTFNILLDMAARSGTPVLAEWILREIDARGFAPDRFTHTTLITYHGLRGDGEGVRAAYRRLVDAGEIVDTVVLNAVMAAFLRAGQPQSAEYIYENMKRAALDPPSSPAPVAGPADWAGKRRWAKHLKAVAARRRRVLGGYMAEFNASLAPDVYTCNMVILQSAKTGDYERAMALLAEMDVLGVPVDETILVALLKGFYWYGGMRHTPWTPERLDEVVAMALDKGRDILMEKSLAKWILMGAARVHNSKDRVLRVWGAVRKRWKRQGGEIDPETREVLKSLIGQSRGV